MERLVIEVSLHEWLSLSEFIESHVIQLDICEILFTLIS